VRETLGWEMLDAGASRAFAVADHQVAHVYVADPGDLRAVAALVFGILLPLLLAEQLRGTREFGPLATVVVLSAALLGLLFGELLERALFFKASSAPKMPGAF